MSPSPEIVSYPWHHMADEEAQAWRDFHYLNMESDNQINLDLCPRLSLSMVGLLPPPSAWRNCAFTISFLGVPNWNGYMESLGKLWEDICFLVLNSAFPNVLDHIMTLSLVKSINFLSISYAVEYVVKWCVMADGVTIDQRVFNEATKTNFTQPFHKSY